MTRRLAFLVLMMAVSSCGDRPAAGPEETRATPAASAPLHVYSGRNEALVGPILERFRGHEGIEVRVRYGETAEMAATLLEEGVNSPADVFIAQDAAALASLSTAGLLRPLPGEVLDRVPGRFRSPVGDWVGLSGRARTVVYNTRKISPTELPQSLEQVGDPRFRGRFGLAPINASFQAHMAAYRAVTGAPALRELLGRMVANEPRRYPNNGAIVQAVIAGEIDWGLVNHYYLWRALGEDPTAPAANFFMPEGSASSFVNLAGAGVVSDHPDAPRLLAFLLGDEAQRYFAESTFEYPLAPGVPPAEGLTPLGQLATAEIDFAGVAQVLPETLMAINDSGLVE